MLAEVFRKLHFPACLTLLIGGNSSRQRGIRGPTPFTNKGQELWQPPAVLVCWGGGWRRRRGWRSGGGPGGGGKWSEGGYKWMTDQIGA